MTADLLADVLALHARGFAPIPVPYKQKAPVTHAWQDLRLDEAGIRTAFGRPSNVGVLLGDPSGGLVDADLDCPGARALARFLLPPTDLRSGRSSAPESHRFYRVEASIKTAKFVDPLRASGGDRAMLVELRATGAQTLAPPSVHPSGEPIVWTQNGAPAAVNAHVLQGAVAKVATGALLVRYWPAHGSRHAAALALGGGLLRAGWDADEAAEFVGHIAQAAGDDEADDRRRSVRSTADALRACLTNHLTVNFDDPAARRSAYVQEPGCLPQGHLAFVRHALVQASTPPAGRRSRRSSIRASSMPSGNGWGPLLMKRPIRTK